MEMGVDTLNGNYSLIFPSDPPNNDQILKWNSSLSKFTWVPYVAHTGSTGSLSSVGLLPSGSVDAVFNVGNSPLTSDGEITLDFENQAANTVFCSPNGVLGKPSFRALNDTDLPASISAAKISGVLNKANIPNGTNATSFQIGATGNILTNDTNGLKVVASDGATIADLTCNNLNITGTINQSNVVELNVDDQWINLLNGFNTGVPTLNGGVKLRRGSQLWTQIQWVESKKRWQIGISDNQKSIVRSASVDITSASVSANSYNFKHDLNCEKNPIITVVNNAGVVIGLSVTHVDANNSVIRFDRVGAFTGAWTITAVAG